MVKSAFVAVVWVGVVCGLALGAGSGALEGGAGGKHSFGIRGIKGLWWEGIEKYQKALPWVAEHDLNFLMLCYTSFPASAKDWRADYSAAQLKAIGELAKE